MPRGQLQVADLLEDLYALVAIRRRFRHATKRACCFELVAPLDGEIGQGTEGLWVAGQETQRGLMERGCLLRPTQPQLGQGGMGQRLRDFFRVLRCSLVLGDPVHVGRALSPPARLESIFAQRDSKHELPGHGTVGFHELPVAFLQPAELLVDLAQSVVQGARSARAVRAVCAAPRSTDARLCSTAVRG